MENNTKDLLMQYLVRIAEHFELQGAALVSFKRRALLFEQLKQKDNEAWVVMDNLFNAFVKADRIQNDKEKYDKARVLWEAEHAAAEKEKVSSEVELVKFFKERGILVGQTQHLD